MQIYSDYYRILDIIDAIHYPDYNFETRWNEDLDSVSFRVIYTEPDILTGVNEQQEGRWWVIPNDSTNGQIVQTAFKAILTSMEHRVREHFLYKGKPVLMPHMDIDKVWEMMDNQSNSSDGKLNWTP